MKRRTVLGIVVAVVVLVSLAILLVYLPVESTSFTQDSSTTACAAAGPCDATDVEFTLGDHRFATLSGTWMSNSTVGDIIVTINNGPSNQACLLCSGQLYSSLLSIFPSGSFDVSGFGPFHVSVNQVGSSAATTTVQGTVDSAVL